MLGEKRKRAYGQACLGCREKKVACDAVRPTCGTCKDNNEQCTIPLPARPLRRLQTSSVDTDAAVADLHVRIAQMEGRMRQMEEKMNIRSGDNDAQTTTAVPQPTAVPVAGELSRSGPKYHLTTDSSGNVIYQGPTSWSERPIDIDSPAAQANVQTTQDLATDDSFLSPIFQAMAAHRHVSVDTELGDALLNTYFCYQVFNIIQRSTFLRDMAFGGPFFSEFLLMAMYASATRMIDGLEEGQRKSQGDLFSRLAKEHMMKELEGPSKITTVQGLFLLSGRECVIGNVSHGWNLAGLAFQMILDLGIHLPSEALSGSSKLSYEERTARERLYWCAFIWDKTMCLALGREPAFPPRRGRDPSSMPEFDDDAEAWTPFFWNINNCPQSLIGYSYQPKRRVFTFQLMSRLCLILHELISEIYSKDGAVDNHQRNGLVTRMRLELDQLWAMTPNDLKFNTLGLCPPPWIHMFEMMYHATCILLYRHRLRPSDIKLATGDVSYCLQHSRIASQMTILFDSTFDERIAYAAIYSTFVASSFDILLLEADRLEVQVQALERLQRWLDIMDKSVKGVPTMHNSVQQVTSSISKILGKHMVLAMSESGQKILNRQNGQGGLQSAGSFDNAFEFFDLLDM